MLFWFDIVEIIGCWTVVILVVFIVICSIIGGFRLCLGVRISRLGGFGVGLKGESDVNLVILTLVLVYSAITI